MTQSYAQMILCLPSSSLSLLCSRLQSAFSLSVVATYLEGLLPLCLCGQRNVVDAAAECGALGLGGKGFRSVPSDGIVKLAAVSSLRKQRARRSIHAAGVQRSWECTHFADQELMIGCFC